MTQNPDGHASKGDEKHERTVQRRVCGFGQRTNCGWVHSPPGMAAAYEPTPKGALALHLTGSSRCFQRCPASSSSCATASARCDRWWRLHFLHSTGSVDAPRARVARIARVAPHTIHTHTITQSPPPRIRGASRPGSLPSSPGEQRLFRRYQMKARLGALRPPRWGGSGARADSDF